jgi:hypothetical protein
MRTWLVIFKKNGKADSRVIMAKTFDDAVYEIWGVLADADIKGIFEVAK